MHTRYVSQQWKELPSNGSALRWRLVDALSRTQEVIARITPERLRRLLPLVPALLLVGSLVVGLLALAMRSLHDYDSFLAVQGGWSLAQYTAVLTDPQFHTVVARTLLMAVILPVAAVAIGVPFAMTMTRCPRRWMRLALLIGLFVPLLTGDITRTYGLLAFLGPNGPVEWVTSHVGLGGLHILGSPRAIGIGIVQTLLPAAVVVLLPAVLRIDPELGSAAMTLGASPRIVFWRITLPQLRTGIVAALATTFALTMAAFADPAILGRGLQSFVSNFLQDRYLAVGNPPQGAAIGIILLVIVSVGTALLLTLGRPRRRGRK
ncbi:ABC transporter permease [Mycolicibacterium hodleri]|uniref:ABC transporter permease n=1 Tax=Mycolicibacterium hodleri TaxID=49897 RepID=A0A502DWT4_9MYCO|nr:ABC transporter permease [Mycolicibacterium hodleri]TPG29554.1 ABC transporter permease [Mycolicibacterium hodleri]